MYSNGYYVVAKPGYSHKNVILEWHGEMKDAGIDKREIDGQTVFTITADNVNDIS